jgi:hypothetical protein
VEAQAWESVDTELADALESACQEFLRDRVGFRPLPSGPEFECFHKKS